MLLDFAKLLFQKDTRESFKELIAFVKKKPEWKKDLISIDEHFAHSEEKKAELLIQFCRELLIQKDWPQRRAGVAEFAIQEIVDNAFVHGKTTPGTDAIVRLRTELSSHWIQCEVSDNGLGFDLGATLSAQAAGETRGLSKVKALASDLTQADPNTIKVRIESKPGQIELTLTNSVYVIDLNGSFRHGSLNYDEELQKFDAAMPVGSKVVVDATEVDYMSSVALRLLLMLQKRNKEKNREAILVMRPESVLAEIIRVSRFDVIYKCVDSRADALTSFQLNSAAH